MSKRYLPKNEFRSGRPPGIKKKTLKNKQNSKVDIGQTLETEDKFLPHDKNRMPRNKTRPVLTVYINECDELVVIPCSTQNTRNTRYYGKNGIKYYRNVIEIEDDEGKPIKVGEKFKVTDRCTKLPIQETKFIANQVINHTRNSSENRKRLEKFKNRHKKRKS